MVSGSASEDEADDSAIGATFDSLLPGSDSAIRPKTDLIRQRKRHQGGMFEWRITPSKRQVPVRLSPPDNGAVKGSVIEMPPLLLRQDLGQNLPAPADAMSRVASQPATASGDNPARSVGPNHSENYLPHPTLPAPPTEFKPCQPNQSTNERQSH